MDEQATKIDALQSSQAILQKKLSASAPGLGQGEVTSNTEVLEATKETLVRGSIELETKMQVVDNFSKVKRKHLVLFKLAIQVLRRP